MICAYCHKEAKGTKEHIISSSILKLFPECSTTYDEERGIAHNNDPVIKDVCAECNNMRLPYIDSYAKSIIESYFIQDYHQDESLDFRYDLALVQKMCLKFAFNDLRSRNKDTSFFDDDITHFLLDETLKEPLRNVSILAGLAVDILQEPEIDAMFGNRRLFWGASPLMLSRSLISEMDPLTGKETLRVPIEKEDLEDFPCRALSYVFRFNSLQILMFCWTGVISDELLKENEHRLATQYPYRVLGSSGKAILSRCTGPFTYNLCKVIDTIGGQCLADEARRTRQALNTLFGQAICSCPAVLDQ